MFFVIPPQKLYEILKEIGSIVSMDSPMDLEMDLHSISFCVSII